MSIWRVSELPQSPYGGFRNLKVKYLCVKNCQLKNSYISNFLCVIFCRKKDRLTFHAHPLKMVSETLECLET